MVIKKQNILGQFIIEETHAGVLLSISSFDGRKIKLNDEVISSGRSLAKGIKGRVIQINRPYQGPHTSDVIGCLFDATEDNFSIDGTFLYLKFEDFEDIEIEKIK